MRRPKQKALVLPVRPRPPPEPRDPTAPWYTALSMHEYCRGVVARWMAAESDDDKRRIGERDRGWAG